MSLHNIAGPGTFDRNNQRSFLFTFPTPTDRESMFWYTGRLRSDGSLLRMKLHAHNTIFVESFFFAASPDDLGLTERHGFQRSLPHITVDPHELDFKDNAALKAYILKNLASSQDKYDSVAVPPLEPTQGRPMVVCQSLSQLEVIGGFAYDRRSPTSCNKWEWKKDQIFTVVGFNKHRGFPLGPHKPSMSSIPPVLAGHVGYWMSYDSKRIPPQSDWGYSQYNHEEDGGVDDIASLPGISK
jgi:hypothetical protein